MNWRSDDSESDYQPIHWLGKTPIYTAHLIVAVLVVCMVAVSLLSGTGKSSWLQALTFSSQEVWHGQVWRIFTYGLLNGPSINFAISLYMLATFGKGLEQHFGRRLFLKFYACIYLLPPFVWTLLGLWFPASFAGGTGALAVFVAFATLHPEAEVFFQLSARWAAVIIVGLFLLMSFSARDFIGVFHLLITIGFAFSFVKWQQGQWTFGWIWGPRSRSGVGQEQSQADFQGTIEEEMDRLLDKISSHGIGSLSSAERARMEDLRARILKNGGSSR